MSVYYEIEFNAFDWSNDQYDIVVHNNTGSQVGTFADAAFWNLVSQVDRVEFPSRGNIYWADDSTVN